MFKRHYSESTTKLAALDRVQAVIEFDLQGRSPSFDGCRRAMNDLDADRVGSTREAVRVLAR